jgi:hypothetical protein
MQNVYVRDIIYAMANCKEPIVKVYRNRLTDAEINFIGEMAVEYNKTVIFGSMQDIIFNKEKNIYIVE